MRSIFKSFLFLSICSAGVSAASVANEQTPEPFSPPATTSWQSPPEKPKTQKPIKRASTPRPARVTMVKDQEPVAPQVVTVVHRLSGVKLLRYLLRESGEQGAVYTIDREAIANDAHASIIAGLALEDGRTIAARLPQVAAEMEVPRTAPVPPEIANDPAGNAMRRVPRIPRMQPDLTVMTQDGRTFRARYVGIDGQTGLSVLQLTEPASPTPTKAAIKKIAAGESVHVFAPEQVSSDIPYQILVRIGKTDAQVARAAARAEAERIMLRSAKLTPNVIGGVACDQSGNTLGIVDQIQGASAQLLTVEAVRAATKRVLERQNSVPRPLLGIRGEAIDLTAKKALMEYGWNEKQLEEMIEKQIGILLTSVMPGTPAAQAKLRPGDVIMRVNDKDVKSAEEFSTILTNAGSGEEVKFTIERPQMKTPLSLDVRLGGAYQPNFEWQFEMPEMPKFRSGLSMLGLEAVALSTKSAQQWGGAGVLIVSVEPESAAAKAGMREGDVIESIDGRPVGRGTWTYVFPFNKKEKHVFSVVREREKKQIVIEPVE